jgi:hypothetical protein
MKVAVIGPDMPDYFAENLLVSLRGMGHDAYSAGAVYPHTSASLFGRVATEIALKSVWADRRYQGRLVERVLAGRPDLVLTVESILSPETVARIRRVAPIALWFPDAISNLSRMLMFAAPYDLVLFKEPRIVERIRAMFDLPVHYLPEACNPTWHRPVYEGPSERVVVVAGNMYVTRVRLLERLYDDGIPLRLFGAGFPRWYKSPKLESVHTGRYIVKEEKAREFRAASVVLNSLHPAEIDGVNCRLFEAAGCGAAVLSEDRTELKNLFDPHREVATFSRYEELLEKLRYLLDNPTEGRAMGDRASVRAHGEHTYAHRLDRIFELLS